MIYLKQVNYSGNTDDLGVFLECGFKSIQTDDMKVNITYLDHYLHTIISNLRITSRSDAT